MDARRTRGRTWAGTAWLTSDDIACLAPRAHASNPSRSRPAPCGRRATPVPSCLDRDAPRPRWLARWPLLASNRGIGDVADATLPGMLSNLLTLRSPPITMSDDPDEPAPAAVVDASVYDPHDEVAELARTWRRYEDDA